MSDLAVGAAHPSGVMRWLRYDASREADVEAAYDTFVRARPGVFAFAGIVVLILTFVALLATGALTLRQPIPDAYIVGTQILWYGFLAVPALLCPPKAMRTLLLGCTDLPRTLLFAAGVGILISIAEMATFVLLSAVHVPQAKNAAEHALASNALSYAIFAIVLAPPCEEFFVQGWFQTRVRAFGPTWSAVIATTFFLMLHAPKSAYDLIRGGNLAFAAYLRSTTRSLAGAMTAHLTNNAFFFALFLLSKLLHHAAVHHL